MFGLFRVKQYRLKGTALIFACMVSTTVTAQNSGSQPSSAQNAGELVQQAMMDMQYADEQGFFVINGDEVRPVMPLLVSSDGLPDVAHDHVIAALDDALARGCDINQPDLTGLSPLNTAILQSNVKLVRYLVEHGADPALSISSSSEDISGLDSNGLLDVLSERAPDQEANWQQMRDLIGAQK